MRSLTKVFYALFSAALLLPSLALADDFFVESLKARGGFSTSRIEKYSAILKGEAAKVIPTPLSKSRNGAATIVKSELRETAEGAKLILKRYDMGEFFSTIEISEVDSNDDLEWTRLCSRALRDLVYGNFRQPVNVGKTLPVATR